MTKTLFLTFFIFCFSKFSYGQSLGFSLAKGLKRAEIPIEINNNLVIIPVTLNGMLPLKFILDTGVRTTILTEKSFADILNLTYTRKYTISGLGGENLVDAFVANNVSLDIPGVRGEGHAILVLAEDYLQLKSYLGVDVHGILGYELFSRFVIKIDYERKILSIMQPDKLRVGRKYEKLPMQVEDTKPYIMSKVVQQNDVEIQARLLIDTGASHGIMLEPTSNNNITVPQNAMASLIGRGLGGVIMGRVGRVKSFSLRSFVLNSPHSKFSRPK